MVIPKAFAELQARKKKALEESDKRSHNKKAAREKEENNFYRELVSAIEGYDGVKIGKITITLKKIPDKNTIFVYFNKRHWMTMWIKRQGFHCNCENICTCDEQKSTNIILQVEQHRKESGYENYLCYFPCDDTELKDADKFAEAMDKMIHDFEWDS
jgi:hypothetical protein